MAPADPDSPSEIVESGVDDRNETVISDQFLSEYSVHRLVVDDRILFHHLRVDAHQPISSSLERTK